MLRPSLPQSWLAKIGEVGYGASWARWALCVLVEAARFKNSNRNGLTAANSVSDLSGEVDVQRSYRSYMESLNFNSLLKSMFLILNLDASEGPMPFLSW